MIGYASQKHPKATTAVRLVAAFILLLAMLASASAQHAHHHGDTAKTPPGPFVASTEKPFAALMDDAMAVMDDGMKRAPMNGVPEHDFVTMMIPHHQGAIDMAKAMLLSTKDPEMRNLAQGIITEQQNEIRIMQSWLRRYQANASSTKTKDD